MLWPALRAPRERIVMDIGDPVLNASILEWNARTLPLSDDWWNFPAYAPANGITAFTEHLLGFYPVAMPLRWLTGHPVVTYDLLCLLAFPLTGLAMFWLARRLTGSDMGAFAGAVAVTFAPYRVSQLSHVQMLWTFGIPLALLGLHQWVDDRVRRGLVLFAAGWLVTAAANGYLMAFFGIYLLFWVGWFCTTRATIDRVPAIAAAGLLATLPLVPVILGYFDVHREYGLQRSAAEVASYGAELTGILRPAANSALLPRWLQGIHGEGALYPGLSTVALAILALVGVRLDTGAERRVRGWVTGTLLATAIVFLAAAAVAATTNVRYELGFVRLSISNPGKPLTFGMLALVATFATHRHVAAVLRARSPIVFYTLMVLVSWVLSLGPVARLDGVEVAAGLPYQWLLDVPGMAALRVPARFWLLATVSLGVLAAYGAARLTTRIGRVMAALAVALMVLEGWPLVTGTPLNAFPGVAPARPDAGPVLELPLDRVDLNTVAMLRAVTAGYRTMNGYSGFEPPHFAALRFGVRMRDSNVVNELQRWTPFHVSVPSDDADGFRTWITRTQPEATLVAEAGGRALYALPRIGGDDSFARATRSNMSPAPILPFAIVRASCGHSLLPDVSDGSLVTRWECGPGQPGQFLEADLGAARSVSGIVNSLGSYINDAPRSLRITLSEDGSRWTTGWEGLIAPLALRAAFENPARMDVRVGFPPARARYVRITQTGEETEWFWSVAELTIVGE
jgi:hypothetical protein